MEVINNIAIIFMAIFFEALPFLLLGSLISSIIERYIGNEIIAKLIPKNIFLGSIVGIFLGFFLPACDCAVIPVSRRLIKKKVPLNVAVSFMLSSPIINPVVLLSTYTAFYNTNPSIFYLRLILGITVALIVGLIVGLIFKSSVIKEVEEHECHHNLHEHTNSNSLELNTSEELIMRVRNINTKKKNKLLQDIKFILTHTAYDLLDVLKYLMVGALIASSAQILLPQEMLKIFKQNEILSIVILMLFAYLMSLCSTSDSFVGKSFLSTFTDNSVLAYLLLGPMIDIKNTIVLLGHYKKKFVFTLITLIFITIFISTLLVVNLL